MSTGSRRPAVLTCAVAMKAAAIVVALPHLACGAPVYTRVVAQGDTASNLPDGVGYAPFSSIAFISMDGHRVTFLSGLDGQGVGFGNDTTISSWQDGQLSVVAREGDFLPGSTSYVYGDLVSGSNRRPVINASGSIAFWSAFYAPSDPTPVGQLIALEQHGTVSILASSGDAGPSLPPGVIIGTLNSSNLAIGPDQRVMVAGSVAGPGVNDQNRGTIFSLSASGNAVIARTADQAGGQPEGVVYSNLNSGAIHGGAYDIFSATLQGPGVSFGTDRATFAAADGLVSTIIRNGDNAPAFPGLNVVATGLLDANLGGDLLVLGALQGPGVTTQNNSTLWMGAAGSLQPVARAGSQAPGLPDGVVYANAPVTGPAFSVGHINASGDYLFNSWLTGPDVTSENSRALFGTVGGDLRMLLRTGDQAPGYAAGVIFQSFTPVMNDAGQIIVSAFLTGPGITSSTSTALFGWDISSGWELLLGRGREAEIEPGIFRTVNGFTFNTIQQGDNTGATSLANDGRFVVTIAFDGIGSGLYIGRIPCPASVMPCVLASLTMAARRRRPV